MVSVVYMKTILKLTTYNGRNPAIILLGQRIPVIRLIPLVVLALLLLAAFRRTRRNWFCDVRLWLTWPRATQFCANTRLVFGVEGRIGEELIFFVVRMLPVRIQKDVVIAHRVQRTAHGIELEKEVSIVAGVAIHLGYFSETTCPGGVADPPVLWYCHRQTFQLSCPLGVNVETFLVHRADRWVRRCRVDEE